MLAGQTHSRSLTLPSTCTAFDRAVQVWKDAALHVRGELRRHGVAGPLRKIDTRVAGTRGIAAPRQIYDEAIELHLAGMSEADILTTKVRVVEQTVALACSEARARKAREQGA